MADDTNVSIPSYNPADLSGQTGLLRFYENQLFMKLEKVAPAQILSYDRASNRAKVQVLNQAIYSNGDKLTRLPIENIPVLMPAGGGFVLSFPIAEGDLGWLVSADTDISVFKTLLQLFAPATYRKHKYEDSFFIPDKINGFEALASDSESVLLTSTDGSTQISIKSGSVTITAASVTVNGNATVNGSVTATGDVTAGGISLMSHVHSGVETGSSTTGAPQ